MKVCYDITVLGLGHVFPKARTGVFRVVENVAEQLVQQGVQLQFVSELKPSSIIHSIDFLKDKGSFSSIDFPVNSNLKKRLSFYKKKQKLIEDIGNETSGIKKLWKKIELNQLRFYSKVHYLLNDDNVLYNKLLNGCDIYHSPFSPIPKALNSIKEKSIFLTSYDLIPILFPQFAEKATIELIQNVLKSITPETWVLCISHATRNDLLNYLGNKVNADRVLVTELAASDIFYKNVDADKKRLTRKKYNIPEVPYVLSLCTLEPRKNIDGVIRAFFQMIKQEHIIDLNLVLVGTKGWMFEKIFEEIESESSLRDRIIVTGFVADEDLAAIYSDALVFVYPSFYEGFGLPPLEAMQCGIPVITSNTSSLPEVVGNAGIMIEPTDSNSLCEKMLLVYKDQELRNQMSERSLERASRFSWERCGEETVNAYRLSGP